MNPIVSGVSRIVKLFVDDRSFALAIVAWLGGTAWLLPRLPSAARWCPLFLFGGLACILLIGAHWAAQAKRVPRQVNS